MTTQATDAYPGISVLETMDEARNYGAFLAETVAGHAAGARRIVDFGAGQGTLAGALAEAGHSVLCIEPDPELRARIAAQGLPAHPRLPEGDRYDFIYSINVLEHVEDDGALLRSLRGSLRPGGRLLLYVPAFMCLYSRFDRRIGHYRRYTRPGLRRQLREAGFVVERAVYADSLGFLAGLAYRVLGPADGGLDRRGLVFYDRFVFPLSQWIDRMSGGALGKNLLVVARVPDSGAQA